VDDRPACIVHTEQHVVAETAGCDRHEGVTVQLMSGTLPDRDANWSYFCDRQDEVDGHLPGMIDWAWSDASLGADDETRHLAALTLCWALTCSHRPTRDNATKALIALLEPAPHLYRLILHRFIDRGDDYIEERLLAVGCGLAQRTLSADTAIDVAEAVLEFTIGREYWPQNYLSRDYTRRAIEAALKRFLDRVHSVWVVWRHPGVLDAVSMAIVSKAEREQAEARRLAAAELFAEGVPPAEVARRLGVSTTAVCKWRQRWLAEGADGLRSKGSPGYPRLLDEQQHRELAEVLGAGPAASGLTGGWTLARVATLIRGRFGVRYRYPSAVATLLHRLGFSVQKPARRAVERDEQAIADWRTHTWSRILEPPKPAERGSAAPMSLA
jgi:transposase